VNLSRFVLDLLTHGKVILVPEIIPFSEEDKQETNFLLQSFYRFDVRSMPLEAPDFHEDAALWAAQYLCRALQFVMVRNHEAELIQLELKPYTGKMDADVVYSADLVFRHLPEVFRLAKGISPNDVLVKNLLETAKQFSFSAVGMEILDGNPIPENRSLAIEYADRVIAARDRKLAAEPQCNLQVQAALGGYARKLWPEFEPFSTAQNS
jgi:hypothetical protein